jgi:hypothetical protein
MQYNTIKQNSGLQPWECIPTDLREDILGGTGNIFGVCKIDKIYVIS